MAESARIPRWAQVVSWILQLVVAVLLAQTLYFKLGGEAISVWIFDQLGVEPWGRYLAAAAEGTAAILLVIPATAAFGAVLACGILVGAIASHLLVLGVVLRSDAGEVLDDGSLFAMAVGMLLAAAVIVWLRRGELVAMVARKPADPA